MVKRIETKINEAVLVPAKRLYKRAGVWMIATIVVSILLVVSLSSQCPLTSQVISSKSAGDKTLDLINKYFVQGASAQLSGVSKESGLYKVSILYNGQKTPVYMSLDGMLMILPGAGVINISEFEASMNEKTQNTNAPTQSNIPKTEKPSVELFVMSHCPYGTQIEKGILPVVNLLKDKIDFKVRFVHYAMHGKTEVDEELRQYCIQKDQPDKFLTYLSYFLEEGNSDSALTRAGIDKNKLNACITATDAEFKVTENYNDHSKWLNGKYPLFNVNKDLNTKYGVGGSPTLIINGVTVQSERDSASLLKTVCSAFSTTLSECNSKLSSEAPGPGFGYEAPVTGQATGQCG